MKAPIFSTYTASKADTTQKLVRVIHLALEQASEQPCEDEQRYPALFAYARNPFEIRVVYDEQPTASAEDFQPGQHVRYVPYHAEGDTGHPDCENGIVSSTNHQTQTVFVRFGTGCTAQGCKPDQLR